MQCRDISGGAWCVRVVCALSRRVRVVVRRKYLVSPFEEHEKGVEFDVHKKVHKLLSP
jgi:hypothetical protein